MQTPITTSPGNTETSPATDLVSLPSGTPPLTVGWHVANWAMGHLRQPNGEAAGQPFRFTPEQLRFLLWWYAVDSDGKWLYRKGVRRLSKGSGKSPFAAVLAVSEFLGPCRFDGFDDTQMGGTRAKPVRMPLVQICATSEAQTENTMRMVRALLPKGGKVVEKYGLDAGKTQYFLPPEGTLKVVTSSAATLEGAEATFAIADEALALDTPVPTPIGWTTVGEIEPGDVIFGSNGPATVTYTTPVHLGRPCFRVSFNDGTSIIADEGHLWSTRVVSSAAKPKIRRTGEMFRDGRKFAVPFLRPFDGATVETGIDPYVMGLWLGDGMSRWAGLTVGREDLEYTLSEVRRCGVPAAKVVKSGNTTTAEVVSLRGNITGALDTKDGSSIRSSLARWNLLGNKHVPAPFLRAALNQRLALLQGMMDSDGHIAPSGSAVFVNTNERLVSGLAELVRSLGYEPRITSRVDTRWSKPSRIFKVTWRPDTGRNPFRMPRKRDKVRPPSARQWRTIVSIEPVDSVPVKCIEVDTEDHLFVAGTGFVLTHNTEHWLPGNGGTELMATLEDNLSKSGSRLVETANAWREGRDSVAEASYRAWQSEREGKTRGKQGILYDSRTFPGDLDMSDRDALYKALELVYSGCWWVDIDAIIERIYAPEADPDDSMRKYGNIPTSSSGAWVPWRAWHPLGSPDRLEEGDEIAIGFDGSLSGDATALVACRISDGLVQPLRIWEPRESGEPVPVDDVDAVLTRVMEESGLTTVAMFMDVAYWESFVKITWPKRWGKRVTTWSKPGGKDPQPFAYDLRGNQYEWTKEVELVRREVLQGDFRHTEDPVLSRHVLNAVVHETRWGDGIRKRTKNSPDKIDAAVGLVLARMARRRHLANVAKQRQRTGKVW